MLMDEYKREMLEYIRNISPQELEKILVEIGSRRIDNGSGTPKKYTKEEE